MRLGVALLLLLGLTACNGMDLSPRNEPEPLEERGSSIFGGEQGINLTALMRGEGIRGTGSGGSGGSFSTNKYLWRASLQTLSFLPIEFADPGSGFIQTEWYQSSGDERFRIEVFILGKELRTESLEVAVHSQMLGSTGWRSTPTSDRTLRSVENAILLRARQLKVAELE